jgi:hypothetical protein
MCPIEAPNGAQSVNLSAARSYWDRYSCLSACAPPISYWTDKSVSVLLGSLTHYRA